MKWRRVTKRGAPEWLYERIGVKGTAFWIRHQKKPRIERRIVTPMKNPTWMDAFRAGEKLLTDAKVGFKDDRPVALVRTETLCNEIVALKRSKSRATYELCEIFMRVHLIPYFNQHCPYGSDLSAGVWDHYKTFKRLENPEVALFNHWKYFVMLYGHARKAGVLRSPIKLEFNEAMEDNRERGQLISDDHLRLILSCCNKDWRDRILIQRYTGMRPGEVRCLKKDRVDLKAGEVRLRKEDTKTRQAREFSIRSPIVLEVLRRRAQSVNSEFFFPSRGNPFKPMDRCLTGWENAIARANEELVRLEQTQMPTSYTPHDLRHTFLTHEFKKSRNPALICFAAGLSMEEAQKTYLHFTANDTVEMAEDLANESLLMMSETLLRA